MKQTLKRQYALLIIGLACLLLTACGNKAPTSAASNGAASTQVFEAVTGTYKGKPATAHTAKVQQAAAGNLPIGDFLDGAMMKDHSPEVLIAPLPFGIAALSPEDFSFTQNVRPETLNPSIYEQMKVKFKDSGLYQLADGVYQIRGDLSDITLVRGSNGWIIIDAGTTIEFTKPAWEFAHQLLPGGTDIPVSTVIYSHSHVDHFGGVKGFISAQDVEDGKVQVIAPYGFMQEALAENVIAGSAMLRRAQYHFGSNLDMKADGTELFYLPIITGLYTLIAPTLVLPEGRSKITEMTVDGVEIHFKDISGAEAPAATILYLPKHKMIFNSELIFRGLHNIYTLRGAQVRDALGWSKLINEVIVEWADKTELMTGPHGPTFAGRDRIKEYMSLQRDNYGFIHNQALRLINSGMKIQDVGQAVEEIVPEDLSKVWHTHGYHGTYSHNARGVVNRYIGFYDGNPSNLNPLQLKPEALKFVEYMGGSVSILEKAKGDFDSGNYRFVATAVNKLVTAEPNNWEARHLLADAYEQLGYQSEGPQWRNAYLTAAKELRTLQFFNPETASSKVDLLSAATIENLLDSIAVRIDAVEAAGEKLSLNLIIPDTNEKFQVVLANSNLSYISVQEFKEADTTLTIHKKDLLRMMSGQMPITELARLGAASIEGSLFTLVTLIGLLEKPNQHYEMVPMP